MPEVLTRFSHRCTSRPQPLARSRQRKPARSWRSFNLRFFAMQSRRYVLPDRIARSSAHRRSLRFQSLVCESPANGQAVDVTGILRGVAVQIRSSDSGRLDPTVRAFSTDFAVHTRTVYLGRS